MIDINMADDFNLETLIKYDYPYAHFGFGLVDEVIQADQSLQIEDVSEQLPLYAEQGNIYEQTLVREMKSYDLVARKDYLLVVEDEHARKLFDYVWQYAQKQSKKPKALCLYAEV